MENEKVKYWKEQNVIEDMIHLNSIYRDLKSLEFLITFFINDDYFVVEHWNKRFFLSLLNWK